MLMVVENCMLYRTSWRFVMFVVSAKERMRADLAKHKKEKQCGTNGAQGLSPMNDSIETAHVLRKTIIPMSLPFIYPSMKPVQHNRHLKDQMRATPSCRRSPDENRMA
jgi:hypothetical protein